MVRRKRPIIPQTVKRIFAVTREPVNDPANSGKENCSPIEAV
ncbi:hypothetical protein QA612_06805 [Evansella sp. AB-P1]|nr:hypothetical protein [Evansella sp. AB-P1]MDG5787197.1 hypothetical protein [Evansella sp. AB-P1]